MFDIGWSELLLIGVVALIVVGPKDLPMMFRALGQFTAKARSMAREFQRAMENAAEESGAGDVAKDLRTLTSAKSLGLDSMKSMSSKLDAWDAVKRGVVPDEQAGEEAPAIHGPETAALAEKVKANVASAEARAAEIRARAATEPTPEELADVELPANPPVEAPIKVRAIKGVSLSPELPGDLTDVPPAAKPARKAPAKRSAKAEVEAKAEPKPKAARKPAAKKAAAKPAATEAAEAVETAAAKPARKPRKTAPGSGASSGKTEA